jgi:hypothetical protein
MANIVLLLVIIMLVFSVIGITLFRDSLPEHFSNLSTGILIKVTLHYKTIMSPVSVHQHTSGRLHIYISLFCLAHSFADCFNYFAKLFRDKRVK